MMTDDQLEAEVMGELSQMETEGFPKLEHDRELYFARRVAKRIRDRMKELYRPELNEVMGIRLDAPKDGCEHCRSLMTPEDLPEGHVDRVLGCPICGRAVLYPSRTRVLLKLVPSGPKDR